METKFFYCKHCGNVVVKAVDSGVVPFCCGEQMVELVPNTEDGAAEKHVPVVEKIDSCTVRVKIGSEPHPMLEEHHICFIYVETEHGGMLRHLKADGKPEALFCNCKDKIRAVYEFCNIHGLWKTEVKEELCDDAACCTTGKMDEQKRSGRCCSRK